MSVLSRIKEVSLCAVSLTSYDYLLYGRVVGTSQDWTAMRRVQGTGEAGPICLFDWDDVNQVDLDSPKLEALSRTLDAVIDSANVDPDQLLERWIREARVVTLTMSGDEESTGLINEVEEDWIWWTEYSSQGTHTGNRVTRRSRIQMIEGEGERERRIEANAGMKRHG